MPWKLPPCRASALRCEGRQQAEADACVHCGDPYFSLSQILGLALCVSTAQAFAPSFMGQGLNLRQAKASSALSMKIELAPLPYDYTALEPKIGKQTLEIHHDKHHAKYVNVANQMIEGTEMEKDDAEAIFMKAHKDGNAGLFNNAAQAWNHDFYWKCMKPGGGGEPTGAIAEQIKKDFGSYDEFKKQFDVAGNTAFGSVTTCLLLDMRVHARSRHACAHTRSAFLHDPYPVRCCCGCCLNRCVRVNRDGRGCRGTAASLLWTRYAIIS